MSKDEEKEAVKLVFVWKFFFLFTLQQQQVDDDEERKENKEEKQVERGSGQGRRWKG